MKPSRPVLRYYGSKYRIADWVVSHFPPHQNFVDVFGGSAAVLMAKPRSKLEVYNDVDERLVTLFRVLRNPAKAAELQRLLELTPYSRAELELSYHDTEWDIESCRRMIVRAFQGFGSDSITRGHRTGFRSSRYDGFHPAREWFNYPDAIPTFTARLQKVCLENRSWEKLIPNFDDVDALFYLDPPYVMDARSTKVKTYAFEMADNDHERLLELIKKSDGMFVVSGYESELYNDLLVGWEKRYLHARADTNGKRIEVLWLCPRSSAAQTQPALFA